MKHLKSFKEDIVYKEDWMRSDSKIREELEFDINQILVWIKDYGYRCMTGGWIDDNPYVWIKFDKTRGKDSEVIETIGLIKSYLKAKGYKVWIHDLNESSERNHQVYINFKK